MFLAFTDTSDLLQEIVCLNNNEEIYQKIKYLMSIT